MEQTKVIMNRSMFEASCFTHSGTFHADDVMSTAIIAELASDDAIVVCRTNNMSEEYPPANSIVYDIGHGEFDHHQKGGNGYRENGVPYAACGLIWKKFGMRLCAVEAYPEDLWRMVDEVLIQGIDAIDNGAMPKVDYPCGAMTIASILGSFNPDWDTPSGFEDQRFERAVDMAREIFRNVFQSCKSKLRAKRMVEDAIKNSDGELLILNKFMPWQDFLFSSDDPEVQAKADTLLYVIYPANRGGYQFRVVPTEAGSFEQRNHVPESWLGLRDDALKMETCVSSAKFVHPNGFIGGADELDDCIAMAQLAIVKGSRNK